MMTNPQQPQGSLFRSVVAVATHAVSRVKAGMHGANWTRINPPPPPEGGWAEGYEVQTDEFNVLICWFKSTQREGYDGVITMKTGGIHIVHIPPEDRQVIFEAAKSAYCIKQQ